MLTWPDMIKLTANSSEVGSRKLKSSGSRNVLTGKEADPANHNLAMVMELQKGDIAVSLSASVASAMASLLPLASVSQQPYVSELLSFTLDRLHKEPELLRVDTERIQRQMLEVAVGNYRAFISPADALVAIKEEVSSINKHLESMITVIPNLTSGCTEFVESAEHILEKRKMNQTLPANHSTLLECVRNGNYDEALDLEAFVCKLSTLHPKFPVIQALAAEVRQTTPFLLSQLLQKFRSNIQYMVHVMQLPECLLIIGYLRRIGVFGEYEMRLQVTFCTAASSISIPVPLFLFGLHHVLK
ncbi:hypothetical protein J1N35_032470 [Gossypium stocksii]|uniref:Conserved oligomeric Golgi complex subunit 8 n=1 Tax=Gossypium stocksii TaxID=47602 RepID=A0A9D3V3L2_9ROSI|nr:hypothetical protein J1N35_032470 [Gossypium stocksii]